MGFDPRRRCIRSQRRCAPCTVAQITSEPAEKFKFTSPVEPRVFQL